MNIGKKLTLNAGVALMLMISIGAAAVLGIIYIERGVTELTQKSTPYQIAVFNHQGAMQTHAANLLKTASSESMDEFKKNAVEVLESEKEQVRASQEVMNLGGKKDEGDAQIAEITKNLLEATEKRIALQKAMSASIDSMRKKLGEASGKLKMLDDTVQSLQQGATKSMISNIDKSASTNANSNNLVLVREGFKDLTLYATRFPSINDRKTIVDTKEMFEGVAAKIMQAVKSISWQEKTAGDELYQRMKDLSGKMTGAFNLKLKYLKEEDEALRTRAERIAKDTEYELTYLMPAVLQEFQKANAQQKMSVRDMSKSVGSFTGTNEILLASSTLMTMTSSIESNISYSFSLKTLNEFERSVGIIQKMFDDAMKTHKKLHAVTANYSDANKLCSASSETLMSVQREFLGKGGTAENIRASLKTLELVSGLNLKMKNIIAQEIQETAKDITEAKKKQEVSVGNVRSAVSITIKIIIGVAAIALVCSILFSRWIALSVVLPIGELACLAEGFRLGNFNMKLNEQRKDEFGRLAGHFNTAVGKIHEIIGNLTGTIERMSNSATELADTSAELYRVSQEQTEHTEQSVTATTQIEQTVSSVAKNADDASSASKEALDRAASGKEIVAKTVKKMEIIADSVRDAASNITRLSESSEKIGLIVKTINEIADQTNLLALNAAIEAARAGEQGRGFAVVADEVRKLAERTSESTKEIGAIINEIHEDTKRSVSAMEGSKGDVEEGVKFASDASRSLEEIVSASTRGVDMAHMIASATSQQASAAEHVSLSMENIRTITKKLESATKTIAKESKDLSSLAAFLKETSSWFKLK
ncbi:MAG: methyl-accepting chemotaxis protein [Nitrospirae bacterium]|nr:MAG: methyl-accepting chemotaxis protein [Nitrospirota bacterium]